MREAIKIGILTVSDKGAQGLREDESGSVLNGILAREGYGVTRSDVVPDDRRQIRDILLRWIEKDRLSLILTTGGTGLSPRDVTPQAMSEVVDFEVPGMAEAMRAASLKKTPHAMLSRAMAGVRRVGPRPPEHPAGHVCLIINLPGSPGGARDNFEVVLPALDHALSKLAGDPTDCYP